MKKLFSILVVSVLSNICFAQSDSKSSSTFNPDVHPNSVVVHYGVFSNISNPGWKTFIESYNQYTNPSEPLTNFKNHFNIDIGYKRTVNKLYLTLLWQHTHNRCEAGFDFNEVRRFDYIANTIALGAGVRVFKLLNDKLNCYAFMNYRFGGHSRIVSSYIYRDGYQSYGSEKDLNGTYLNSGLSGNEIGLNLNYRVFKGLALEFQFLRQSNNRIVPSFWGDLSNFKTLNASNFYGMIYLPEDYKTYMQNGGVNYTGKNITSDFRGFKMTLGLSYRF